MKQAVAIIITGLVIGWPLLVCGFPMGFDAPGHLSLYHEYSAQFRAGELLPRWLRGMEGGLGCPQFFLLGPLPYLIPTLLEIAGIHNDVRLLGLTTALALISSGLIAYLWIRRIAPAWAALAVAILSMMLPDVLANVYEARFPRARVGHCMDAPRPLWHAVAD